MASKAWEDAYEAIKPKIAELKALIESIEWSGGIFSIVGKVWMAAKEAVVMVEEIVSVVGPLTSEEKENLAVQAVDDAIVLNKLLELVDGPIIRIVIKTIVAWFNKKAKSEAAGVSFLPVTG